MQSTGGLVKNDAEDMVQVNKELADGRNVAQRISYHLGVEGVEGYKSY
jgi:hypothetical protein